MYTRDNIRKELETLAPSLIEGLGINVFSVPEDYFEQFPLSVSLLKEPAVQIPFQQVPEGYFENFAGSVLAKIKSSDNTAEADETRELSPLVYSIGNGNVYTVPSGYFNGFAGEVLQKVVPAKVVAMPVRKTFARYAMAAVITGVLGLAVFFGFNNDTPGDAGLSPTVIADAKQILAQNNFDAALQEIPADAIEAYLADAGLDVNAALVASAAFEDPLPEVEDYFIDEGTLDNFLQELNLETTN